MRRARIDPNTRAGEEDVGHVRLGSSQLPAFQCPPGTPEANRCFHDTVKSHLELASASIPNTFTRTFMESSLSETITIICIYLGSVHKNTVSSRSLTHFGSRDGKVSGAKEREICARAEGCRLEIPW